MKMIEAIGWLFLVMFLIATAVRNPSKSLAADPLLPLEEGCAESR